MCRRRVSSSSTFHITSIEYIYSKIPKVVNVYNVEYLQNNIPDSVTLIFLDKRKIHPKRAVHDDLKFLIWSDLLLLTHCFWPLNLASQVLNMVQKVLNVAEKNDAAKHIAEILVEGPTGAKVCIP